MSLALDGAKVAPWSEDTPTLLTESMTHLSNAVVVLPDGEWIHLEMGGGTVTFDETRSPRVDARLTCQTPTDQAILDRIDPRTGARLLIFAGYLRPDNTYDVQPLVDLSLRSRTVGRPADTLEVTGAGDETILLDAAAYLAVGAAGTIESSSTTLDRDSGFANQVWVSYEWRSGSTTNTIEAIRKVNDGPYAAVAGNAKILRFDRTVATTQARADAAAAALVKRTVTRGSGFTITAISAYWLRPGMTVEVQLPLGDAAAHLVTSVEFDLREGTMRVTTRLPDGNYTIGA